LSLWRPTFVPSNLPLGGAEAFAGVEVQSIARGFVVNDALVKKARARIMLATAITPGKFLILFDGSVADCEESLSEATLVAGSELIDSFFLPYAHDAIEPAVFGVYKPRGEGALGIVETATACSGIYSCDAALKAAPVVLALLHLSAGIGGKCFYVLCGELCDIEASVEAAKDRLSSTSRLVATEIIPRPHEEFLKGLGL
jgi:microcompartment protein CcmL/EutN